jgi:hypothetical protein
MKPACLFATYSVIVLPYDWSQKKLPTSHREDFMIWLDMTAENGRTLYLDIRSIESRRLHGDTVFAISGILGDGQDEAEVLMDIGQSGRSDLRR